mgnify:FL=1
MVLSFRVDKILNMLNTTVEKRVKLPVGRAVKCVKLASREFVK